MRRERMRGRAEFKFYFKSVAKGVTLERSNGKTPLGRNIYYKKKKKKKKKIIIGKLDSKNPGKYP